MNSSIELHDSVVFGIGKSDGSIVVNFCPAYVHLSEGIPGIDPGSVWLQDLDLVLSEAVLNCGFIEMPQTVLDGSMSVDDEVFDNIIPLPIDIHGSICLSVESWNDERTVVRGNGATVVPVGEASYLEGFC